MARQSYNNLIKRELVLLARTKHNSIEKEISKALTDADISHNDCTLVSNEMEKYHRLK